MVGGPQPVHPPRYTVRERTVVFQLMCLQKRFEFSTILVFGSMLHRSSLILFLFLLLNEVLSGGFEQPRGESSVCVRL